MKELLTLLYVIIYKDWSIRQTNIEWEAVSYLDSDTDTINCAMVKTAEWYKVVFIANTDITLLP